jgi:hypothetical protein
MIEYKITKYKRVKICNCGNRFTYQPQALIDGFNSEVLNELKSLCPECRKGIDISPYINEILDEIRMKLYESF